jgi:hypothetical protein
VGLIRARQVPLKPPGIARDISHYQVSTDTYPGRSLSKIDSNTKLKCSTMASALSEFGPRQAGVLVASGNPSETIEGDICGPRPPQFWKESEAAFRPRMASGSAVSAGFWISLESPWPDDIQAGLEVERTEPKGRLFGSLVLSCLCPVKL